METADPSTALRSVENISKKGPRNCRSLGCASTVRRDRRDDKGKGDSMEGGCAQKAFFISLGGPQAHDRSDRDDKGEGGASV